MIVPWWYCGFDVVLAPTRDAAAFIGRVPREAVRGPYAMVEAASKVGALRDTKPRYRFSQNEDSGR